mgnify:FL=1
MQLPPAIPAYQHYTPALLLAAQENEGTVPPDTDITPADPTNSGTALWNKLLKVPAARKLYDWEVKLQVFIQGIWSLQYVALAAHWMIKDEVSCAWCWQSNHCCEAA